MNGKCLALCVVALGLWGCAEVAAPEQQGQVEGAATTAPIKYVVVLIKENHTFDNYFTGFPGATSSLTAKLHDGRVITRPIAPTGPLPRDLCHGHSCASKSWNKGRMNGFDLVSGTVTDPESGQDDYLAYARFTETQIPNYWQYARHFTLADHFFATTAGPSFPGHFASVVGFSPWASNPTCGEPSKCDPSLGPCSSCVQPAGRCTATRYDAKTCAIKEEASDCTDTPTVVEALPPGVTWAEYGRHSLDHVKKLATAADRAVHMRSEEQLLVDLASADQPNVIFAHLGEDSEHPNQDVCPGENYSVRLLNTIMKGPHWAQTAVFLTWDDYGGWYDSVTPTTGAACPNGDHFNTGFRVPLIVVSPYARPGFVFKTRTEQASIPRFIEDLYGLPRLALKDSRNRDAVAGSLMGAFDFTQAPNPPLILSTRPCP
ncbi:MAG: hypothetical protein K1X89_06780 [Myxococcaceae bacterium]|nr:hypothetical protein [Myxococcaceae bacterium]